MKGAAAMMALYAVVFLVMMGLAAVVLFAGR
jgi:hypothetical protein